MKMVLTKSKTLIYKKLANQEKVTPFWVCGRTNHKSKDCYFKKGDTLKS